MEHKEEPGARVLYQAGIVAFPDVLAKLGHLELEVQRPREPRPDGSWIERVILRPDQIEPVVAAGAVVVIEAIHDLSVPAEWIMSGEEALARLDAVAEANGYVSEQVR